MRDHLPRDPFGDSRSLLLDLLSAFRRALTVVFIDLDSQPDKDPFVDRKRAARASLLPWTTVILIASSP